MGEVEGKWRAPRNGVNRPEAVSVSSEVVLAGVPDEDRATIAVAI